MANKVQTIIGGLSDDALKLIKEANGRRQGDMVFVPVAEPHMRPGAAELAGLGLVGKRGGLTMLGSLVAGQIFDDLIGDAFGLGA